jgi:hypothetical protein
MAILSISKLTVLASATTTYGLVQSRVSRLLLVLVGQGEILFPALEEKGAKKSMDIVGIQGNPLANMGVTEVLRNKSKEKVEKRGGGGGTESEVVHNHATRRVASASRFPEVSRVFPGALPEQHPRA